MTEYRCDVCGQNFKSSQALGSHLKYKHGGGEIRDDEGLDMKADFIRILQDLGVRKGRQTLADIFFDLGVDSLTNLEYVLRMAGVTNPAKTLVVTRWGQRIGKKPSEDLTRDEKVKGESMFDAYDRIMEAEMKELLMEDLRMRIKSRRSTRAKRVDEGDGLESKIDEKIAAFKLGGMMGRGLTPRSYELMWCPDPYHYQPCGVCLYCGGHIYLGNIPWGGLVTCQRCGAQWSRTF
jgi:DNA-directed RNA polymerase subunit RPC12/RpoP